MQARERTGSMLAARLTEQFRTLSELLEGLTEDDIQRRGPGTAWSAREHLAHLGRYHEVTLTRLQRIRDEAEPTFVQYSAETDPNFETWLNLPTPSVIANMRTLRRELVESLGAMEIADLQRIGIHPVFGALPVKLWIQFFLIHEAHHYYQLFKRSRDREPDILSVLDRAVHSARAEGILATIADELEEALRRDQSSGLIWRTVPLDTYDKMPIGILSSWMFALRRRNTSGAERHPNSIQRVMCYRGDVDLQTWNGEHWQSHWRSSSAEELEVRWLSIPINVWHRPVIGDDECIVVSFHTARADRLIEERAMDDSKPGLGGTIAELYLGRNAR
ncbi:MAG: DinB family protein [Gemmatimonadota bacterium]|nr:DinB family protein [Gemmatimonadota bacterium]